MSHVLLANLVKKHSRQLTTENIFDKRRSKLLMCIHIFWDNLYYPFIFIFQKVRRNQTRTRCEIVWNITRQLFAEVWKTCVQLRFAVQYIYVLKTIVDVFITLPFAEVTIFWKGKDGPLFDLWQMQWTFLLASASIRWSI